MAPARGARLRGTAPKKHPAPSCILVVTGNPPGRQLLAEMDAHAAGRTPPTPGRASNGYTDSYEGVFSLC